MAQPNRQDEKNIAQAARDNSRRITADTHQFAEVVANVGENAIRAGTELLKRNSEILRDLWETGRKMATQFTDQSINPFYRAFGMSDQEAKKAAQRSSRNMVAVLGSSTILAEGVQNISREWLEFAQSRVEQNLERLNALSSCRTAHDVAAVQSELLRDNVERLFQSARRTAEISARTADSATRKITETQREGG